jgi:hypothetical protein
MDMPLEFYIASNTKLAPSLSSKMSGYEKNPPYSQKAYGHFINISEKYNNYDHDYWKHRRWLDQ